MIERRITKEVKKMEEAVLDKGWDGEWFLRAYDAFEQKVGSKECEEGKIFILRPEMPCISKFETREEKREEFYQHGFDRMEAEYNKLCEFLKA